jgi:hypothetical protein
MFVVSSLNKEYVESPLRERTYFKGNVIYARLEKRLTDRIIEARRKGEFIINNLFIWACPHAFCWCWCPEIGISGHQHQQKAGYVSPQRELRFH